MPWMYAGSLINTLFPARQGLLVDESLPNEWSPDTAHEGIVKDTPGFGIKGSLGQ